MAKRRVRVNGILVDAPVDEPGDGLLDSPGMAMNLEELILRNDSIDMKVLDQEQRGQIIHDVIDGMGQQAKLKDIAWLKLGMLWSFIVKNKLYKYAGEHIRNANDFLKEIDIGVGRREMDNFAQIARIFGRLVKTHPVPIRKLVMIAPLCTDQDQEVIAEWFSKAQALPSGALEDEVREAAGRQTKDTCDHPAGSQEVWIRCGKCGKFLELIQEAPDGNGG